jgi:hypothetical protein
MMRHGFVIFSDWQTDSGWRWKIILNLNLFIRLRYLWYEITDGGFHTN